jgi:hypothetical protein
MHRRRTYLVRTQMNFKTLLTVVDGSLAEKKNAAACGIL